MAVAIVATLNVQAGKEKEFEAAFGQHAQSVRANEPGNRLYQLCKSRKDPGAYVVMELYESEDAMKAHGASEHQRAFGPRVGPMLAGRPDIHYLDTI